MTRAYVSGFIGLAAAVVSLLLYDFADDAPRRVEAILRGASLLLAAVSLFGFGRSGLILVRYFETKK